MKKRLIFVLLFLLVFTLAGCKTGVDPENGGDDKPFSWEGKEVSDVSILRNKMAEEYDIDEFDLSMLYVEVEFADGTKQEIKCNDEHISLSEADLKKLTYVGKPRITVVCTDNNGNEVETAGFVINLVSYTLQDTQALDLAGNVIMARRSSDGTKVEFFVAKTNGLASGQLQFKYNKDVLTLGEVTKNANFYGNVKVEDGKISIGFASDANLEVGTVICSIVFSGDYRNSGLALNEEFNNQCFSIVENAPVSVDDIAYHVSRK